MTANTHGNGELGVAYLMEMQSKHEVFTFQKTIASTKTWKFITNADRSHVGRVISGVCLSVCLSVFPHGISKTDLAGITKLDTEMFHHESWKQFILGSDSQRSRSQSKKQCRRLLHSCECWLVLVITVPTERDCVTSGFKMREFETILKSVKK